MTPKTKIIVAMSGGVDSSVAAALLAEAGHETVGVTLRLLPKGGEGFGCCGSPEDVSLVRRSADRAGIPHYVLDYSPDFERDVIRYFVDSYVAGETPNPCLACNKHIKFDRLFQFAKSLGATHVATGHYARIVEDTTGPVRWRLFEAADPAKDQSYVLYNLSQETLGATLFPVGDRPKPEIRDIARRVGLPNADKKDSQEICFVPGNDYRAFVADRAQQEGAAPATMQPGPIKDATGREIGTHRGIAFYTVGQRQGLGLSTNERTYVTKLDAATNTMTVGDDRAGFSGGLETADAHWLSGRAPTAPFEALIKIRYKHTPTPARIEPTENGFRAVFHEEQRAVTPGQAAVIYRMDDRIGAREVIGGGKIARALPGVPS